MFINADQVFPLCAVYRLVWIGGRFGGHKTSLAYKIAQQYLEKGYRLITNTRCVWADEPETVKLDEKSGHMKAVVVLDEGGLEFKASRQIEQLAAYANKMDLIYIMPSFFPPVRDARVLTIQPIFNLKSAGLPLVVYKWRVRIGDFEDKSFFLWWDPSEMYGIYSRQDPGNRTIRLVQLLLERKEEYRKRFGYDDNLLSAMEEVTEADLFRDAANQMGEVADIIAALPSRVRRKR